MYPKTLEIEKKRYLCKVRLGNLFLADGQNILGRILPHMISETVYSVWTNDECIRKGSTPLQQCLLAMVETIA
jgi:hypothetical protein